MRLTLLAIPALLLAQSVTFPGPGMVSGGGGPPAPALVQSAQNSGNGLTNATVQFSTQNTAAGNQYTVCVSWTHNNSISTVTDSESNSYTLIKAQLGGGTISADLSCYSAKNVAGGTKPTVTIAFAGANNGVRMWLHEFSGLNTSNPIDGTATGNVGASGLINPGSITTAASAGIIFGVGLSNNGTAGHQSAGYTVGITCASEDSEYKVSSSAGTYTPSFTADGSAWIAIGVGLKQ